MAGESLRKICADDHLPEAATVHRWVIEDREGFYKQYTRARQAQAVMWAEEILEMADDSDADHQRSRLQVDTRKWLLSKVLPKVYGDKVTLSGDTANPLQVQVTRTIVRPDGEDA
jgi:hypothetical protein